MIAVTHGDATVLELDHGKVNALDLELLREIVHQLDLVERSSARAVILTGRGKAFSAGVDLHRVAAGGRAYTHELLPALDDALVKLARFPRPVVAAINGHALAGGCVIACACDFRIMARGTGRVGVTELAVGAPFPSLALELVRHCTPAQHHQQMIYLAETYLPEQALAMGLVDRLVDEADLAAEAHQLATRLGAIPSVTFEATKVALRAPMWARVHAAVGHQAQVLQAWGSAEVQARIRSFVETTLKK